jgi:2-beta-glucuronyltransferase
VNISLFSDSAQPAIELADATEMASTETPCLEAGKRVVLISGYHDYRTGKRASIHQIADGLVRAGLEVAFISTRFSMLSKWRGDSRLALWDRANSIEVANGVQCLLWRTFAHPFSSRVGAVQSLNGFAYDWYSELPSRAFDELVRSADYVILESGAAAIYLRRIRRMNADAKIIYYGADRLETINAHPFIRNQLEKDQGLVDHFSIRATALKDDFPFAEGRRYKSGFGISEEDYAGVGPSPYAAGSRVAVSVGSMLFDSSVFALAAQHFPDTEFHVIGCGTSFDARPNVHIHSEMSFERTLPFLKHASIGIAAYAPVPGAEYLAESSLKLAQFEYFGLPAVCPSFAVGSSPFRFGYESGNEGSIRSAVESALSNVGSVQPRAFPTWQEVALQVIEPVRYDAAPVC